MRTSNDLQQSYGQRKGWTYRVLSELWTCPDDEEAGRRRLSICRVHWADRPVTYPLPEDIAGIDVDQDVEHHAGFTLEELEADHGRVQAAFDEPALIRAEWERKILKWERVEPVESE
jgi:hypothetical protein